MYVDDLLVIRDFEEEIVEFKKCMKEEYDMTGLCHLSYFLRLKFVQTTDGVLIHQKRYVNEVLKRFNILDCNNTSIPIMANLKLSILEEGRKMDATLFKQIVGSLRFVCNNTPVSIFMGDPRKTHLIIAKHILRYLKGTTDFGLFFLKGSDNMDGVLEA